MKKNIVISASVICVIVIGLSIWFGGRERWEVAGLSTDFSDNTSSIATLESKLKEEPDAIILNYNLAYFYYKAGRFDEARSSLNKVIESGEESNVLSKKVYYNMGNSLFRLAEKETDLQQALSLFSESLRHYKSVIEIEKQERAYSSGEPGRDEDTEVNFTIVRRRIKILADKLNKQQKDSEQQKNVYQLVKELLAQELEIRDRLADLENKKSGSPAIKERDELLKIRTENRKLLQMIQKKVENELGATSKTQTGGPVNKIKSI